MISTELFNKTEAKMLHLVNLWNIAETVPQIYDALFVSNPHELADIIQQGTTFTDWQYFINDNRVQDYIDRVIYAQAGVVINKMMQDGVHLTQAESAKLNAAIKYRDDHRPNFATPVQYIYIQTPLTPDEQAFLPDVPENKVNE
jgi:hypothetical protein